MAINSESIKLWTAINSINWNSKAFSYKKAYVCSFFSKIAYEHVPEFELKQSSRIKIIPCQEYFEMLKTKKIFDIKESLRRIDFGDIFIIQTKYVIALGIRTGRVTIIAIRGTVELNDWLINLNIKHEEIISHSTFKFHFGFHKAISECFDPIYSEIIKSTDKEVPIYITGHSLGGAMAAILHAYWGEKPLLNSSLYYYLKQKEHMQTHSCYTFGMPRYGNSAVVDSLPSPYHFYNEKDIVPTIPPEWLGFRGCSEEYKIGILTITKEINRRSVNFLKWMYTLAIGGGIESHDIKQYNRTLENFNKE